MTDNLITPLGEKVLVKPDKSEEATKGGIILTKESVDKGQNAMTEGTLVKMGLKAFDYLHEDEMPKIGDRVYFIKYAGVGRMINDEEYRICNDEDIFASDRSES